MTAVIAELDPVNLPIYVQAIRRFFAERIPHVVARGRANWRELDWHVAPTAAATPAARIRGLVESRATVPASRVTLELLLLARAAGTDHVSRLPLITRGSRKVLQQSNVTTVAQIAATTGDEPVYAEHTRLKSDRRSIPAFAAAITAMTDVDAERTDGMLARYADLEIFLSINFDPGAGLLTGIGLRASFAQSFPFGQRPADAPPRHPWRNRWIVAAKTAEAERNTILAFLQELAAIFEIPKFDPDPHGERPECSKHSDPDYFVGPTAIPRIVFGIGSTSRSHPLRGPGLSRPRAYMDISSRRASRTG